VIFRESAATMRRTGSSSREEAVMRIDGTGEGREQRFF
jgi:hypothetical protein